MADDSGELLSDIGNRVLAYAEVCLADASLAVPEDVFFSHMKPPDDCCDWLATWIRAIRPSTDSLFPNNVITVNPDCGAPIMAVDYSLGIVRGCWPNLRNDKKDPFPDPDDVQIASDELAQVARTLWCCLQAVHAAGVLMPPPVSNPSPNDPGLEIVWGPMLPWRGGGCAGWEWHFTVNVPGCCWDIPALASGS